MRRTLILGPMLLGLIGLSLAGALAACGKQADLERPAPSPAERARAAEQQRNEADSASNATAAGAPIQQQNPAITPYTDPGPVQDNPIPGERTNPSGSANPNPQ